MVGANAALKVAGVDSIAESIAGMSIAVTAFAAMAMTTVAETWEGTKTTDVGIVAMQTNDTTTNHCFA
jgi:hypothetical protein